MPTYVNTGPNLGSDHSPIIVDYSNSSLVTSTRRQHWNFKSAKWLEYKTDVSGLKEEDLIELTLKEKEDLFKANLIDSGQKHFYLGKGKICRPRPKPWWNEECSRAVALKRRAYNKWRRCPERVFQLNYRCLEAKARKIIVKVKKISWRKFCSTLNLHTSCSEVWRF